MYSSETSRLLLGRLYESAALLQADVDDRVHVMAVILNLANASFEFPIGRIQISMGGKQAIQSVQDIAADIMVPSQSPTARWGPVLAGIPPVSDANTDPGYSFIPNPLCRYDMP